jgi:hypothetical protein
MMSAASSWATLSVREDEGVTHERVAASRPAVLDPWASCAPGGLRATEVSVSVADRALDGAWVRSGPTVQVEGGSYTLDAARQLRDALDEVIGAVEGALPHRPSR